MSDLVGTQIVGFLTHRLSFVDVKTEAHISLSVSAADQCLCFHHIHYQNMLMQYIEIFKVLKIQNFQ